MQGGFKSLLSSSSYRVSSPPPHLTFLPLLPHPSATNAFSLAGRKGSPSRHTHTHTHTPAASPSEGRPSAPFVCSTPRPPLRLSPASLRRGLAGKLTPLSRAGSGKRDGGPEGRRFRGRPSIPRRCARAHTHTQTHTDTHTPRRLLSPVRFQNELQHWGKLIPSPTSTPTSGSSGTRRHPVHRFPKISEEEKVYAGYSAIICVCVCVSLVPPSPSRSLAHLLCNNAQPFLANERTLQASHLC